MTEASPQRETWWQVATVVLLCSLFAGATVALWRRPIAAPPLAEALFPQTTGVSLVYRVTAAGGATSRQVDNYTILRGNTASSSLDGATLDRVIGELAGKPLSAMTSEDMRTVLMDQIAKLTIARRAGVEVGTSDVMTATRATYLLRPAAVDLLSYNDGALEPPLPLLDLSQPIGQTRTITGTYASSTPFTATLTTEARETLTTLIGPGQRCARVRTSFATASSTTTATDWYCPELGSVRSSSSDGAAIELVGASLPGLALTSDLPPTRGLSAAGRGDGRLGAFATALGDTIVTRWAIRDPNSQAHVTAPPLAVGELGTPGALLLVATMDGGLQAYDRATHARRWRFQTGGPIFGAPLVADGTVYVGSGDRRVYALDLSSGALRWAFAARDAISSSPVMAGGLLFIGAEDRTLYAIEAVSGRERWHRELGDAIAATPIVVRDAVIVGSDDGALYAFATSDGADRWAFASDNAITAAALSAGDTIFVGSNDGNVYALDASPPGRDGVVRWRYDAGGEIVADMALADGLLIAATAASQLRAIDAVSGQERWRVTSERTLYGAPIVVGDRVFINRGIDLLPIDLRSGAKLAAIPIGDPASYTSIGSDGRELFVGHRNGFVRIMGRADGLPWKAAPVWVSSSLAEQAFARTETLMSAPVVAGDSLVFVGSEGSVYSVAIADGTAETLGTIALSALPTLAPAIVGRTLVLAQSNGVVIGYDLAARRETWRVRFDGAFNYQPAATPDGHILLSLLGTPSLALALDAASGREIWRHTLANGLPSGAAVLAGGRYYVAADRLLALDPADGAELWSGASDRKPYQLAADERGAVAVTYDADFTPRATVWDAAGKQVADVALVQLSALPQREGIGLRGDDVALRLLDGSLLLLRRDGSERWRVREPGAVTRGTPMLAGGVALTVLREGRLIARSLADGAIVGDLMLQQASAAGSVSAMVPLVRERRLYLAFDQYPLAIELTEGP